MGGGVFPFGAPIPPRSGTSPASLAGPCRRPPPVRRGLGPCLFAFFPWRVGLLCSLFFFFASPPPAARLSPWRVGLSSAPPPHVPSPPPRCPRPFPGWVGEKGVGGGGGASSPSVLWRKHVASTAQARGAALVPLQGGGACRVAPVVALPTLRSYPRCPPPLGLAWRVLPTGTVVWSVPHPLSAASPPCRFVLGGGGALSAPPYLHPPPLGGRRCVWRGGGLSSSLRCTHVAGTTQARRRHEARHLSLCRGGGMPCGSRRRPFYPAFAPPVVPPLGLARRVLSTGSVVWSVPHPLAAASPPCRFVLGGGALFAPPYLHPPPLGGRGCGGGGAHVVFPSLHACCRHDASTTQARGEALGCSGGGGGFSFGPSRPSPWYRLRTPGSPAAVAPWR